MSAETPPSLQEYSRDEEFKPDLKKIKIEMDTEDGDEQHPMNMELDEDQEKRDFAESNAIGIGEVILNNFYKAIQLFTAAIELAAGSSRLGYIERGAAFLRKGELRNCINDCSKAIELDPALGLAFKYRGRAYSLLGDWENAAMDLRQAFSIYSDEQVGEWLEEVTLKGIEMEEQELKQRMKELEKEQCAARASGTRTSSRLKAIARKRKHYNLRERQRKTPEREEAHASCSSGASTSSTRKDDDLYKILEDPDVKAAYDDPAVTAAFHDMELNPENLSKYLSNPRVILLLVKLGEIIEEEMEQSTAGPSTR